MINPGAVDAFLSRRLANSDRAKRLSNAALDRRLAALDPVPRFHTKPLWHQKIAFLLALKYGSYLVFLDPGLGKTWVALNLFRHRKRTHGRTQRMLVLVPGVSNIGRKEELGGGWGEEIHKHAPNLSFFGLDESLMGEDRRNALIGSRADVVCATYQGWTQLVTTPRTRRHKRKKITEWAIDKKKIKALSKLFDVVVFDESNMIQNHQGLYYRVARRFIKSADVRLGLTGTPFNRDPTSLWSQFYVVDEGETMGPNLGIFRAAFFNEKENFWSGGVEYEFDRRMKKDLYRMMRNRSIRFAEEECLNLPKSIGGVRHPDIRTVKISPEGMKHYVGVIEELKKARGNFELMKQAYMRARMLCSGYLPIRGEDGVRVDVPLPHNPKLDALISLLKNEIPAGEKVLVVHQYRMTGSLITERLKKEGIKHVWLYGGTKDKLGTVSKFKRDPKTRVMVMSGAGSRGHNLQVSRYMVLFESPSDPLGRIQTERRIRRADITRRPHFIELHIAGSIDAAILTSLRDGCDVFDAIVDGTAALRVPVT